MQTLETWLSECTTAVDDAREGVKATRLVETYLRDQKAPHADAGTVQTYVDRLREIDSTKVMADGSTLYRLGGALPLSRINQERTTRE